MVVVTRPVDDAIEAEISALGDQFQELKARFSTLRKKNVDCDIADLLTFEFAPLVKMARVTYEREDILKIQNLLREIKDELDEAENGSVFFHAYELITEAYESIRNNQFKEAQIKYAALMKLYSTLSRDLKRSVYYACMDLKKKIEQQSW